MPIERHPLLPLNAPIHAKLLSILFVDSTIFPLSSLPAVILVVLTEGDGPADRVHGVGFVVQERVVFPAGEGGDFVVGVAYAVRAAKTGCACDGIAIGVEPVGGVLGVVVVPFVGVDGARVGRVVLRIWKGGVGVGVKGVGGKGGFVGREGYQRVGGCEEGEAGEDRSRWDTHG